MEKVLKIVIIFAICFFVSCNEDTIDLVGNGSITGRVVEANTFDPVENAKIIISPTNNTVFTDELGYFTMEEVTSGDYSVSATKDLYLTKFKPATVTIDNAVNVIFELEDDTVLNRPPSTPNLITPLNDSEEQALSVELIWSSEDPDADAITYRIEIKNANNNDVIKLESVKDTTYVVSNLKYGTKYFWQVIANDGINSEVLSTVSSFKTKGNPENRYLFVKKFANGNNGIYSSSYNTETNKSENEVQLTDSSLNAWRPRKNNVANLIAFLRIDNNEAHIYTMKTNGDDVKKVTSSVSVAGFNLNEMDFAWSPDGSKLLYSSFNKLYSINKDGSGLHKLYETTDGSLISECDWSSDGLKIALKTNNANGYNGAILVVDLNGVILNTIISGVQGALGGLNLSESGNMLLFTRDVSNHQATSYRQLDTRLFIYNFTDTTITDISEEEKESGTNDLDPRFSPNEADIIFVNTSNDGISKKHITKTNLSGNIERVVLFTNATMPDWE